MLHLICKGHGSGNCTCSKYAPLMLRIGLGGVMLYHGILKLQNIAGTTAFFDALNIPAASTATWIIALFETIAGVAIIAGAYVSTMTALVAAEIIIAVLLTYSLKPYAVNVEFDLLIILVALALSGIGAGKYSYDEKKQGSMNKSSGTSGM